MSNASRRIGVWATTVALRGLCPMSAISPTTDPGPDGGDVRGRREDAGLALEHEEALDADVALVDEDGSGLGVDRLPERGHPTSARPPTSGRRARCDGGRRRSPGSLRSWTACCISPRSVFRRSTYPADLPVALATAMTASPSIGPDRRTDHGSPARSTTVDERMPRRAAVDHQRRPRPRGPRPQPRPCRPPAPRAGWRSWRPAARPAPRRMQRPRDPGPATRWCAAARRGGGRRPSAGARRA